MEKLFKKMKNINTYIIPNSIEFAEGADKAGINSIFIDLERIGKNTRQGQLDTHKSTHIPSDIISYRKFVRNSELLVRVNPLWEKSLDEVNFAINNGADALMLPMARETHEIIHFKKIVNKRVPIVFLLETKSIIDNIATFLPNLSPLDRIHFGLNDLSIDLGLKFLFQVLSLNVLETPCQICRDNGIEYGIGGIGRIGEGLLSADLILKEYVRLKSKWVILSRAFHANQPNFKGLEIHYKKVVDSYLKYSLLNEDDLLESRLNLIKKISMISK